MPSRPDLPDPFGPFQVVRKLGEGGMGAVYEAQDTRLGCRVALKVSHFDEAGHPNEVERFRREARLAQAVHHPFICQVFELGEIAGLHYLTMPFVEGTPLNRLVAPERPWEPRRAAELVRRLALALQALHQRQVVHRDLKPHNVMVRAGDEPVLMDFGLAVALGPGEQRLTRTGQSLGTPVYMAPELLRGEGSTPACDIYSLGTVLYELLTGRTPFEADNLYALFYQVLSAEPPRPSASRAGLDRELEAVCLKMLAKEPTARPASMAELASELDACVRRLHQIEVAEADRQRREQEEAERLAQQQRAQQERRQQELARLRQEGEAKLARLVRQALDRTGGKPTEGDNAAAQGLVRQHHLAAERARAIIREVRDRWQQERPPGRPGPDDPCPCGSGKKYRNCHLNAAAAAGRAEAQLRLRVGKLTLLGNYPEHNQDALEVKVYPGMTLCLVADGMGPCGEIASKRATEIIPRELKMHLAAHASPEAARAAIGRAVIQANEEIRAMRALDRDLRDMATTVVVAAWLHGSEMYVAGVGDSRAYLIRGDRIDQLTADDVNAGVLRGAGYAEAVLVRESRYDEVLSRYLGSAALGEGPEVRIVPIRAGDRVLLCTDGLTGVLPDQQLLRHIRQEADVQSCAELLGMYALDNLSRDNVSCILIEVSEA